MNELKLKSFQCKNAKCTKILGHRLGNTLIVSGISSTHYKRSQAIVCEGCGEVTFFRVQSRGKVEVLGQKG